MENWINVFYEYSLSSFVFSRSCRVFVQNIIICHKYLLCMENERDRSTDR